MADIKPKNTTPNKSTIPNVGMILLVILSIIASYLIYKEEFSDKNFSISLMFIIFIYFAFLFVLVYYKYL